MALEQFKEYVSAIVIVVLILGALVLGLDSLQTSIVEDIDVTTYTNVTKSIANNTPYQFTECVSEANMTITNVRNTSSGAISSTPGAGNYSVGRNIVTFNCQNADCAVSKNITYSCKSLDDQYNVTAEGMKGATNLSGQMSTIGTLIGVAALITIVVSAFLYMRR